MKSDADGGGDGDTDEVVMSTIDYQVSNFISFSQ